MKLQGATIVYRTNKIIIKNPRKVTDDMAYQFYKISNIPEKSYYKALAAAILNDKVNKNNINQVIDEWNDFIDHGGKSDRKNINKLVYEIENILKILK